MKKVTGLDEKLTHFIDEAPGDVLDTIPSYRQMYVRACGSAKPENPEDAVVNMEIAMKIKNTKDDFIDLENAEWEQLRSNTKQNRMGWNSWFLSQMWKRLNISENGKEK